jgi:hypothetical protein
MIPHDKIPEEAQRLMVKSLAAQESLHRPLRAAQDQGPAIYAARHARTLRIGGGRANAREAASHWRSKLIDEGLMEKSGHLTADGKRIARSWAWAFRRSELRLAIRRLLAAIDSNDTLDDGHEGSQWVPEMLITGRYWDRQNELLQKCFRPWICDGLLNCGSDGPGSAYYAPGAAIDPQTLLKRTNSIIHPSIGLQSVLIDIYADETCRVWDAAISDRTAYSEIGPAPLAYAGLRSGREYLLEKNIKPIFKLEAATDG